MNISCMDWIKTEMQGLYGTRVLEEMSRAIEMYGWYDGDKQKWPVASDAGYAPTRMRTNLVKKLIKDEARFMAGRAPEIRITPDDAKDRPRADEMEKWIAQLLDDNAWNRRLILGVRDCFIGGRVALKLSGEPGGRIRIRFAPGIEFVHETEDDDQDAIRKAVFFYQTTPDTFERSEQRVFRQRYRMDGGRCLLDEGVYDGYGKLVESRYADCDTRLSFVPAYVIVNDGLSGDLLGESDVAELVDNQDAYNKLKSDDIDAMRFSMFPQKVFTDASQAAMDAVKIAPGAMIDLQTDPAAQGRQATAQVLESGFQYDQRLENAANRIKADMYELISTPNAGVEQLKGFAASGKSMRALYWGLICRVEEKWTEWDGAIRWMVEKALEMAEAYGMDRPDTDFAYRIKIEHLYPIPDDEEEERMRDLNEVQAEARSRLSYREKWEPGADAEAEIQRIAQEKQMLEDAYAGAVNDETAME